MSALPEIHRRIDEDDPLAITPERLHQYYRTMQSEEPAEAEIDEAMARRRQRSRANRDRNRQDGTVRWVVGVVFVVVLVGVWLVV